MSETTSQPSLLRLTSQIVAAHAAHNQVTSDALLRLIENVYTTLAAIGSGTPAPEKPQPAVPVKRSVFPDHIVCLEDGKKLKMLKRHLMTTYQLTPEQYREKWGLPANYPMVAPNYAARRSTLAKSIGLGRKPAAAMPPPPAPEPEPEPETAPVAEPAAAPRPRRGRPPKSAAAG
jgi:predicted transcriptional regulator